MTTDTTIAATVKTPAHTPLPWAFEAGVEDSEGEFYVCHAGTVCDATTVCNPPNEHDAAFIVRACNSHYQLVEALKACLNFIENTEGEMGETLASGDKARAALSAATGEA